MQIVECKRISLLLVMIKKTKIKKRVKFFVGDVECNNPKDRQEWHDWKRTDYDNFVLGVLLSLRRKMVNGLISKDQKDVVQPVLFVKSSLMWGYLKRIARQPSTLKVIVFFYNLKFDYAFFMKYIAKTCTYVGNEVKDNMMGVNTFKCFYQADRNSRMLYIKVNLQDHAMIELCCASQMFNHMKVADIGKVLHQKKVYRKLLGDLNKLTIDYSKKRNFKTVSEAKALEPNFVYYTIQDAIIVKTALLDEGFKLLYGNLMNRTVSGNVFREMNKACPASKLNDWSWGVLAPQDRAMGDVSMRGGLTLRLLDKYFDCDRIYQNVWYTDRVSSYPSEMVKRLPQKRRRNITQEGRRTLCYEQCEHLITVFIERGSLKPKYRTGVWNQRWRDNNHNFNQENYYYHENVFEHSVDITLWESNWKVMKQFYKLKYTVSDYFLHFEVKQDPAVRAYVLNLFKQKQASKPNPSLYLAIKGKINSTYGQLAMKGYSKIKIPAKVQIRYRNNGDVYYHDPARDSGGTLGIDSFVYRGVDHYWYWKSKVIFDDFFQKDIFKGSWITSQARIPLMQFILANPTGVIYTDTDSIFCQDEIKLPTGCGIYWGDVLGDWSPPIKINYLKILDMKTYAYYSEADGFVCKVAGLTDLSITKKINELLPNHHPYCKISNVTFYNIARCSCLKMLTYQHGSALIDVGTKEPLQIICLCRDIKNGVFKYTK